MIAALGRELGSALLLLDVAPHDSRKRPLRPGARTVALVTFAQMVSDLEPVQPPCQDVTGGHPVHRCSTPAHGTPFGSGAGIGPAVFSGLARPRRLPLVAVLGAHPVVVGHSRPAQRQARAPSSVESERADLGRRSAVLHKGRKAGELCGITKVIRAGRKITRRCSRVGHILTTKRGFI